MPASCQQTWKSKFARCHLLQSGATAVSEGGFITKGKADVKSALSSRVLQVPGTLLLGLVATFLTSMQPSASALAQTAVGTPPPPTDAPKAEFAFEFQVTLSPPVVLGDTALGHRQYIPIRGGKIAGPKLTGEVLSGGWDYQLGLPDGCSVLSADYFIRAQDGTVIHVLDEGMSCPNEQQRAFYKPRFEAPKGPHEWLTRGTFVASVALERGEKPATGNGPAPLTGIRLKFYQLK